MLSSSLNPNEQFEEYNVDEFIGRLVSSCMRGSPMQLELSFFPQNMTSLLPGLVPSSNNRYYSMVV